jgi:hypothetical protein
MTALAPPDWVRRYEDLRAHHLGSLAVLQSQAWAMVVFVEQGMRGWMRAWLEPPPDTGQAARPPSAPHACLNGTVEATVLLTNMTLRCLGLAL